MRRLVELTFEAARQRKAIGSRLVRKVRQPEIFTHVHVQIVTCPMCHRRALQLQRQPFSPVAMGGDLRQHVVHRALLDDLHLILMQRVVQPLFVQIERKIGKAAFDGRITIVNLSGSSRKASPGWL